MNTLQSIPGSSLPIFPEADIVVIDSINPKGVCIPEQVDSFVRPVRLSSEAFSIDLESVLDDTDDELNRFAATCGAVVVPHVWGLVEANHPALNRFLGDELGARLQHDEIPNGMALAARVERIVRPRRLNRRLGNIVTNAVTTYTSSAPRIPEQRSLRLDDMRPAQFSVGILPSHGPDKRVILHDIEPFVSPYEN